MSEIIEWKEPPLRKARRADLVASELKDRPKKWALIAKDETLRFFPWWLSLSNSKEFEIRYEYKNKDQPFGLRDVYVRFIGEA